MPKKRTTEEARLYQREWREKNKTKSNSYSREWYQRHKDDPGFHEKQLQRNKDYWSKNKDRELKRQVEYRRQKPERFSVYEIRKNYGVSLEEAEKLYALRQKGCQVCGSVIRCTVDHCHTSLKIRGILCSSCNKALGMMRNSAELLEALATYVRQNAGPNQAR